MIVAESCQKVSIFAKRGRRGDQRGYKFIALKHNKVQILFALKHFQ